MKNRSVSQSDLFAGKLVQLTFKEGITKTSRLVQYAGAKRGKACFMFPCMTKKEFFLPFSKIMQMHAAELRRTTSEAWN